MPRRAARKQSRPKRKPDRSLALDLRRRYAHAPIMGCSISSFRRARAVLTAFFALSRSILFNFYRPPNRLLTRITNVALIAVYVVGQSANEHSLCLPSERSVERAPTGRATIGIAVISARLS